MTNEKEFTPETYQNRGGFVSIGPFISEVAFAVNEYKEPCIWAKRILLKGVFRWVVTHSKNNSICMNKKDGLFEIMLSNDLNKNSFDTWEEANKCFRKFYT